MPDLRPYDSNASCIKCGGTEINTRWVAGRDRVPIFAIDPSDEELIEHHRRTCSRCGFKWNEAVLASAFRDVDHG